MTWPLLYDSGLLTGKFKRGSKPDKDGSRIGFIHQDESRAMLSAPAWSKYDGDEGFWVLMDTMEAVAKNHGTYV